MTIRTGIWTRTLFSMAAAALFAVDLEVVEAQVVPGRGRRLAFDDFEDTEWKYYTQLPKSSREQDGQTRGPMGRSSNGRWLESMLRGTPDFIERIAPPPGGLPGSQGAMRLQSRDTGVPGRISYEQNQDDLIMNGVPNLPVSNYPNMTVRVYLPPFDQWEQRQGSSFGFRADVTGTKIDMVEKKGWLFGRTKMVQEEISENYWPGFFLQYNGVHKGRGSAALLVRGDDGGHDFVARAITQPGWWTLGMSFSPDGRVHYYASPGVDALTAADHIRSSTPYGFTAQSVNTLFFNVVSPDNGRTWSTSWIVDDPAIYSYR